MELKKTRQVETELVLRTGFDLFICASGYESRANFFAGKFAVNSKRRVCLSFMEHNDNSTKMANDVWFKSLGFELIDVSGNDKMVIESLLEDIIVHLNASEINVLVDYSCMTRVWYAAIIKFFKFKNLINKAVQVFFSYSNSEYTAPPDQAAFNKYVGPLDGFYSISIPNKPTALVIGLGYIEARAFGLAEFFDVNPYLFIADSSTSREYYEDVLSKNKYLLSATNSDNVFYYPMNNLNYSETLLYRLCNDLADKYRIVLAPCGPKPFTLICLTTSLRFLDVDVWRISAGEEEMPVDKKPNGSFITFCVTFS